MNSIEPDARWKTLLPRWLAGLSTFLYVLSRFVPSQPPRHYGDIEDSWILTLHVAFKEHLQFGRDIVFNFGPWGFLYGGYHPATHLAAVVIWTVLSLIFWRASWRLARHFSRGELAAALWVMAFTGIAGLSLFLNTDARLIAWPVLLLMLHFFVDETALTPGQGSLAASLGLLSLIKFNLFVLAVVVLLVIAMDNVLRHRRFPWILPVFAASLLFFWILAGQHLNSFGPFLRNSWRITSGYSEAMMWSDKGETEDACFFLLGAALLGGVAGYAAWSRLRFFGAIPLAGLGFILFSTFKYGYVRYDGHAAVAMLQLLLIALACLAIAWPMARQKGRWGIILCSVPITVVLLLAMAGFGHFAENSMLTAMGRTLSIRNLFAPATLLYDHDHLRADYDHHLAQYRKDFPLSPIPDNGAVDVYPWNQAAVFAQGLRYRPRPVIQSYSTFTPELAELNAAFLRSDRAPDWIFLQVTNIDLRFSSQDDGPSWPELLTRYDVNDAKGPFLLLKRSTAPRKFHLVPVQELPIRFGERAEMPPAAHGPIWAQIEINHSLLGTAVSTLYKPPILWLTVHLRCGAEFRGRLVPGIARAGFLLSPLIDDTPSFASLASTNGLRDLAGVEVTSLTITAETKSGSTACYQSPMRLHLYRLEYPLENSGDDGSVKIRQKPPGTMPVR